MSHQKKTEIIDRVKPWELLAEARTPDGTLMSLTRRDTELVIMAGGKILMSSRMHGSEEAMAEMAFKRLGIRHSALSKGGSTGDGGLPSLLGDACVLIGGLGLGYTLRATLDLLPSSATVVVSELVPAVVRWNRGVLAPLAGRPLDDPRVRVVERDVLEVLRANRTTFDATLLDIDNGPSALTSHRNGALYSDRGIAAARAALKPAGTLAVWSSYDDQQYARRVRNGGFTVVTKRVRGRPNRGPNHVIYLGQRPASGRATVSSP